MTTAYLDLLDHFDSDLDYRDAADSTRYKYRLHATMLLEYLEASGLPTSPDDIRKEHVQSFLIATRDGGGPTKHTAKPHDQNTAKTRYSSLRAFFKFAKEREAVTVSPLLELPPPSVGKKPKPGVPDDDLRQLLKTLKSDPSFNGRRDYAIVKLFFGSGMRVDELCRLSVDDLDLKKREALVRGKGDRSHPGAEGKRRWVTFGFEAADALHTYKRARAQHPRAERTDALFIGRKGALSTSGIREMLNRREEEAGIAHLHPHMFRRTWASKQRAAGISTSDTMKLAGWESETMYRLYTSETASDSAIAASKAARIDDGF